MAHPSQLVGIDGRAIRAIRESKGLTQLYLANFVGVTTDTVSRWENGKTQTIKRENLIRLAQALEVEPEELLAVQKPENPGEESAEGREDGRGAQEGGTRPLPPRAYLAAAGAVLAALCLAILLFLAPWRGGTPSMEARRWLPSHAPLHSPFPVVVTISAPRGGRLPATLLLTERLPRGLGLVPAPGLPKPGRVVPGDKAAVVQWIVTPHGPTARVAYLLTLEGPVGGEIEGKLLLQGEEGRAVPIPPTPAPEAAPFHWADADRNHIIDDQELLAALDLLPPATGLQGQREELKRLWAGGAYRWDPEKRRFEVMP